MRRFLPFAALLGVALVLGCQDLGSGPVGPDGLVPQFNKPDPETGKHDHGDEDDDGGCGKHCVFVDVTVTGGMVTDPLTQPMDLARKGDIIKLRANNPSRGSPFLKLAIKMTGTLAALTSGSDLREQRISLNTNCEWSGRVEQTVDNENWVIGMLPFILTDPPAERSVLVGIDKSAFVEGPTGTFVSLSENNTMAIWPTTVGTWPGFKVKGGAPTVTVVGDPAGDDFTARFSGGKVELTVDAPEDLRNVIHLSCRISDDITFTVRSQMS